MNRTILYSSVLFLGLYSCTNDKVEDPNPCSFETADLTYNGIIKSVISSNCANSSACHGTPQDANAGGQLTSYALLQEKINSGAFNNRLFILKDMPMGTSLNECDYKKLKAWYDAGAPQ